MRKSYICFNRILFSDNVSFRSHQTGAKFVKHLKCRLIARQAQLPLKLESRLPWRLCCHEVSPPKPYRQWCVTRPHDGSRCKRNIRVTSSAPQNNRSSLRKPVRLTNTSTFGAGKTVRPAQMLQILRTGFIIRENLLKLGKCCWKSV